MVIISQLRLAFITATKFDILETGFFIGLLFFGWNLWLGFLNWLLADDSIWFQLDWEWPDDQIMVLYDVKHPVAKFWADFWNIQISITA
jgi:hypothetical protein